MSRSARRRPGARSGAPRLEWIGGVLPAPFVVDDAPGGVQLVFWLERPSGLVVGHALLAADEGSPQAEVVQVLRHSLRQPADGGPRRTPDRIRVASESLGRAVRQATGGRIPVLVAPTPELDALRAQMAEDLGRQNPRSTSYLDGKGISPALIGELFRAAALLYRAAPWRFLGEVPQFRVDIPEFGIRGGCLVVVGHREEAFGLQLFRSHTAYRHYPDAPPAGTAHGGESVGLVYLGGEQLPPAMRAEVDRHGWEVADDQAYPVLHRTEPDMSPSLATGTDVRLLSGLIPALVAFIASHTEAILNDPWETPGTTRIAPAGVDVRVTYPFETFHQFDWAPEDPCPCGGEQSYSQCCGAESVARDGAPEPADAGSPRAVFADLEKRFGEALARFMDARDPPSPDPSAKVFRSRFRAIALAHPWALHHAEVEGLSPREHFRRTHGHELDPAAREWFDAEAAAWLGVWTPSDSEDAAADAGWVALVDRLSGRHARVSEQTVGGSLEAGDHLLGRVVCFRGEDVLHGYHPELLPAEAAQEVVERALKHLRRRAPVPVPRLQAGAFTAYLIRRWEEAAEAL